MPKDPTIAIRDCLAEIAILHDIAARTTPQAFRNDPIVRRAGAYAMKEARAKHTVLGALMVVTRPRTIGLKKRQG